MFYILQLEKKKKIMAKFKTRKDKKKEYTGTKAVDPSCRNNGDCPYCYSNRTVKNKKRLEQLKSIEDEC